MENFEEILRKDLHQFLLSIKEADERLPECPAIMDYRLVYCLNNGLPMDMDVYDLAEWCCVTELSRISLEHGGAPVEVPDFTRGAWDRIDGFSYAFAK